jgi:hypothetical protein
LDNFEEVKSWSEKLFGRCGKKSHLRFKQYYSESLRYPFPDLTAYKNYFGETKSMTNAFFDFYFAWFLFPALVAVPLVIYQYSTGNIDSGWNAVFAVFIAICACVLIELWKRKEKQISY